MASSSCFYSSTGDIGSAGGEWTEGMVRTQIREFGNYTILADTTKPIIKSLDRYEPEKRVERRMTF